MKKGINPGLLLMLIVLFYAYIVDINSEIDVEQYEEIRAISNPEIREMSKGKINYIQLQKIRDRYDEIRREDARIN